MRKFFFLPVFILLLIVSCATVENSDLSLNQENLSNDFRGIYRNVSSENYSRDFQGDISISNLKNSVEEGRFMPPVRIKGLLTAIGSLRGKEYTKRAIIQDWSGGVMLQTDVPMNISLTDVGKVVETTVTEARQRYERTEVTAFSNFIVREAQPGEASLVFVKDNPHLSDKSDGTLVRWQGTIEAIRGDAILTLSIWGCPDVRIERFRVQGRGISIGTKIEVIAPLTRFYDHIQTDFVSFFPESLENHLRIEGQ